MKSLDAMGGELQHKGARLALKLLSMFLPSTEERRPAQQDSHPERVTLEALNMADRFITTMDRKDKRPYCVSWKGPCLPKV